MQSRSLPDLYANPSLRAVPAQYHEPDVEEVQDEHFAARGRGAGSEQNPFFFDDSEDDDQSARNRPPPPTSSSSGGPAASSDDPSSFGSPGPSTPRHNRMQPAPSSRNPPSSSKQRVRPKGIYLGVWNKSGLPAGVANAVYGSRDVKDRINRRIAKVDVAGTVVLGGNFDVRKTACKHEDIAYIPKYIGMTKEEVDAVIMPLLRAADGVARNRSGSPSERIASHRSRGSEVDMAASSRAGGFQVRGASFVVDAAGQTFHMV